MEPRKRKYNIKNKLKITGLKDSLSSLAHLSVFGKNDTLDSHSDHCLFKKEN